MEKEFEEGERVCLGTRDRSSMTQFRWSGNEPDKLHEVEWAEEIGAQWEGDELVTYDCPDFLVLLDAYEKGEYTIDNDERWSSTG